MYTCILYVRDSARVYDEASEVRDIRPKKKWSIGRYINARATKNTFILVILFGVFVYLFIDLSLIIRLVYDKFVNRNRL